MKRVLALIAVTVLAMCSAAQARLVASSVNSGSLPIADVYKALRNPHAPRVEVRAKPPDRVEIRTTVDCVREIHQRRKSRVIRTKQPFSGRIALTMKDPDECAFIVIASYVEAEDDQGKALKKGTIKLRLYH
jgi:hypothetical protein